MENQVRRHSILATELKRWQPKQLLSYGTAGFRGPADILEPVVFRCGVVAALRAMSLPGICVGIMITASHNPASDNGVKLIDPNGEMLEEKWERLASELVNATNAMEIITKIHEEEKLRDLAPILQAVSLMGLTCKYFGILTTPQLHQFVKNTNQGALEATKQCYFQQIAKGWQTLQQFSWMRNDKQQGNIYRIVDCANGVGAQAMTELLKYTKMENIHLVNAGSGVLNDHCGADFIQKNHQFPKIWDSNMTILAQASTRFCSIDGDADRLIYLIPMKAQFDDLSQLAGENVIVLEGDRFSVLTALVLKKFLNILDSTLTVGVIQTAYANGASTCFLEELGKPIQIECVATGVKHLERAARKYDIGKTYLSQIIEQQEEKRNIEAATVLLALSEIANQATGDGVANFVLAEALLQILGWEDTRNWINLYHDLPNSYRAVRVRRKDLIKTTNAERILLEPITVKNLLDEFAITKPKYRFLVRPSGTEDVVRIYGEGPKSGDLEVLLEQIEEAVLQACDL
eukprot:jgi/Galph1/1581/GphlegSOOS_G257.1